MKLISYETYLKDGKMTLRLDNSESMRSRWYHKMRALLKDVKTPKDSYLVCWWDENSNLLWSSLVNGETDELYEPDVFKYWTGNIEKFMEQIEKEGEQAYHIIHQEGELVYDPDFKWYAIF